MHQYKQSGPPAASGEVSGPWRLRQKRRDLGSRRLPFISFPYSRMRMIRPIRHNTVAKLSTNTRLLHRLANAFSAVPVVKSVFEARLRAGKPGSIMELTMNPTYDFKGQVALVTGAAMGMGLATARAFAESGASVVLADLNGDRAAPLGLRRSGVLQLVSPVTSPTRPKSLPWLTAGLPSMAGSTWRSIMPGYRCRRVTQRTSRSRVSSA
jgi:short chain dehydrogenase